MFSFLKRMYTYNVISSRSHQFTIFPMWQVLIEYFKLSYSLFEKKKLPYSRWFLENYNYYDIHSLF